MKRGKGLKRGKRLQPVSAKRQKQQRQEDDVKRQAIVRDRGCVAKTRVPEVACWGPLDKHELIKRSAWPKGALVLDNVVIVCRRHHEWIEEDFERAVERGLAQHSWEMRR